MAARAIGSGTIGFGLVSIPVKLYSSVSPSETVSFNNLHKGCGTRVRMQFICPTHDEVLERSEMIKGYEFAKNKYVTFTPEELKAVEEQGSGDIDITEFVPLSAIDPVYFAKAYYLGPDKGGGRAYHLLAAALRETGLCALSRYAARGKQYLTILRPNDEGLVMQQLHYAAEVRDMSEIGVPDAEVKEAELQLAVQLVEQSAVKTFAPEKYRDEVRARIDALIERKVAGEDITQTEAPAERAQVIDLMSALKNSLGMRQADASQDETQASESPSAARKGPKRAARSKAPTAKKRSSRKKAGG